MSSGLRHSGTWQGDQVLEARRQVVCADLTNLNLFEVVEFIPVDANRIRQLFNELKNTISRTFEFPKKTAAPLIKGVLPGICGLHFGESLQVHHHGQCR